ncbi:hypothetical protein AK88_04753 [Plasmodium fragile]|uniref:Uncharacterized protein n=1 Tax=Plasmodium fragile TaxID=5857 RepID=A0A0D9QIQ5_PLAFR|nr:uncharacterized protein AK88_04753 [Plasmodium fragile]KJP85586.1 hypothetical protein AK88_04753 [Plasmodium fragile]
MISTTIRNRIHKIISGNNLILENEDNQTNLKNIVNNCTLIENALRKEFLEFRRLPRNKLNALIIDVLKKTFEGDGVSSKGGSIYGNEFQGSYGEGQQDGQHNYDDQDSHHGDDKWQPGEKDEGPCPTKGKKKKKKRMNSCPKMEVKKSRVPY